MRRDRSPQDESTHCPTCGAAFTGPWCAACGERRLRPELVGLRHYAGEAWDALTDTDGRLLRSLWALLRRPGELTRAWWIGRRRPYLGPIQIFLIASVAFFVISPFDLFSTPLRFHLHLEFLPHHEVARDLVHQRIAPELDRETFLREVAPLTRRAEVPLPASGEHAEAITRFRAYAEDFDRQTTTLARSLVFAMIPLVALASWLLALVLGGPREATRHVVHATHFLAAAQAMSVLVGLLLPPALIAWLLGNGERDPMRYLDLAYTLLFFGLLALHLVAAARRGLAFPRWRAALYALLLIGSLLWILSLYRALLFFVVFHSVE